jgi:hypothetical protein
VVLLDSENRKRLFAYAHREILRLSRSFTPEHELKSRKGAGSCLSVLTAFPHERNVIFWVDEWDKRVKPAFVPLPVFQDSGLGQVNYCHFLAEFFPWARRLDKFGIVSEFTVAEIVLACKHKIFHHGQCSIGGEHITYGVNCGDLSCGSYQDSKTRLYAEIALKDIQDVYSSPEIDFPLGFTTYEMTCSLLFFCLRWSLCNRLSASWLQLLCLWLYA